jgi:hypothetical protein
VFVIEDDLHAEIVGEYATRSDAISELKRRAKIPWDRAPNVAPCRGWRTCGRQYVVIEYDVSMVPWKELSRRYVLEISAEGVDWTQDIEND